MLTVFPHLPEGKLPIRILATNTLAFALSLAVWVVFGPSSRAIAQELHLSSASASLLKAMPILVGSLVRVPVGVVTDRLGARATLPLLMGPGALAALAVSSSSTFSHILAASAVLGLVGATFTVGTQSVSYATPKSRQGTALGIFGAGNIGVALTTLALPHLLTRWGWRACFRFSSVLLLLLLTAYVLLVRGAPHRPTVRTLGAALRPLAEAQTWRLGLYYMSCFGAFVGTSLVLSELYIDAYQIEAASAGLLVTTFAVTAGLMRILGGRLADRYGARRVIRAALFAMGATLLPVNLGAPLALTVLFILAAGIAMGICMGATMRHMADDFPTSVGTVGGLVGAIGGLGGFFVPLAADAAKSLCGTPFAAITPMLLLIAATIAAQRFSIPRAAAIPPEAGDAAPRTSVA